jgi:hypothetical protein
LMHTSLYIEDVDQRLGDVVSGVVV